MRPLTIILITTLVGTVGAICFSTAYSMIQDHIAKTIFTVT